jgi:hypothetical protein
VLLRSHPASSPSWRHSPQTCGCAYSLCTWVCLFYCGLWAGVYCVASWSHVSWMNAAFSVVKAP